MNSEKKMVNLPLIVLLIFGVITIVLAGSFTYFSISGPDYSDTYSEKIEQGQIQNPITNLNLSLKDIDSEVVEEGQIIIIDTEEGERKIIIKGEDIGNLTLKDIQKELISYISVILELYNLHDIPFSSIHPRIQMYIDNDAYYIEVIEGDIIIKEDITQNPDIIIKTTHEEVFKVMEDNTYVEESLNSGKTQIELVASKFILFSKGYLTLYNKLIKEF
jgi:hypothetical protein